MEKIKSHFGARPKYIPVDAGDQILEDVAQSSQREATQEDRLDAADNGASTRKRLTRMHYLASFQGLVIVLLILFIISTHRRRAAGSALLGTDPSGFVPQGQFTCTRQYYSRMGRFLLVSLLIGRKD